MVCVDIFFSESQGWLKLAGTRKKAREKYENQREYVSSDNK